MIDYSKENNLHLFGVFDGHGGREVAQFTKNHYGELLRSNENFKSKKYDAALVDSFLQIDEELVKDWGRDEIATMKRANPPNKSPLMKILGDSLTKEGN